MEQTKICRGKTIVGCGQELPVTEFYASNRAPDGLVAICKTCQQSRSRERRGALPWKERITDPHATRAWRYGLTPEDYLRIHTYQEGKCYCCEIPEADIPPRRGRKRGDGTHAVISGLVVDHDHDTGLVRGLLCPTCNHVLGFLRDDPSYVHRFEEYLTFPPATVLSIEALHHTAQRGDSE